MADPARDDAGVPEARVLWDPVGVVEVVVIGPATSAAAKDRHRAVAVEVGEGFRVVGDHGVEVKGLRVGDIGVGDGDGDG